MRKNLLLLLFSALMPLLITSCSPQSGELSKLASKNFNSSDPGKVISKFADENGFKLGFSNNEFLTCGFYSNSEPDIYCVASSLLSIAGFFEDKITITEKDGVTSKTNSLKIGNIQLSRTEMSNGDEYTEKIILSDSSKEIFRSQLNNDITVETGLTASDLIALLKANGMNVEVLAYAQGKKDKSVLFRFKFIR